MLTVGAVASPFVVLVSIGLRSAPYPWWRAAGLGVAALAFPALRLAPGLAMAVRARLAIAFCYLGGVTALATFGFSSGPGIVLAGTGIFAVILLGRVPGLVMIGLSVAAFLVVGQLRVRGILAIEGAELDPGRVRNWVRMGVSFALLAALLTSAIDYVIRHVEHASRAATAALDDLSAAYERLALLHERLDAAKEEERRFIATELHDELGQILTVIKLRVRMLPETGGEGTAETLALVDQAIERVRKISRDLRPPLLDEVGLAPALRAHVEAQAGLSGVPIELEADPVLDRLPPMLEITCFRIVQESLTNALRHASARRIRVRVARRPGSVALAIEDDGRGFDSTGLRALTVGHLGVIGMQERVRARSGTLSIVAAPGKGTRVEVEIPVES